MAFNIFITARPMAPIGDEIAVTALPPSSNGKERAMAERRRFKQIHSLEERLADEAKRLREEAELLPPGAVRDAVLRKARRAETGSHVSEWLRSPGLQVPR